MSNATKKPTKTTNKETLCWTCKFCTGATLQNPDPNAKTPYYTCPWATQHKPVAGWTAIKTDLKIAPKQTITSYIVESCPYYVPDLEAQITAMSHEEIAKRLEISNRFVRSHQKLSRQVLYVYTKQYVKESRKQYAKTGIKKLDAATRYEMKKHIVEQILLSTQEELLDEAEAKAESSDDMRYNREMSQIEPDCQEMLRKLEWAYKNKSKSKEATASVR